ncbi:MAG TPA: hypothetical protein DEV75_08945 [Desulfovibrio sp.]|jgi:hypothetical protein|nr:hypothetical protein [Desulfovibrio sp.]
MWNNGLQSCGETYEDKRRGLYRQVRSTSREAMGATTMRDWYRLFDGGLRSIRGFEHKGGKLPDDESDALRLGFLRDMFEEARPDRLDDFWSFPRQEGASGLELETKRLGMSVYGKTLGPELQRGQDSPARSTLLDLPEDGRLVFMPREQEKDDDPLLAQAIMHVVNPEDAAKAARNRRNGEGTNAARTGMAGSGAGNAPEKPPIPVQSTPAPAPVAAAKGTGSGTGLPGGRRSTLAAPDKTEEIQQTTAGTLHKMEGNTLYAYIPEKDGKPMDKSSATIGAGIDLGQWSAKALREVGVDEDVINRLNPLLGKNATEAQSAMDKLKKQKRSVELTPEQAHHLNEKMFLHFGEQARQRYNSAPSNKGAQGKPLRKFEELPKEMQAVVTSVLYQHGSTGKFPKFWEHSTKGDWEGAIKELRNFSPDPDYKYHPRRNKEADLMQQGLDRLRQ